MTLMNHVDRYIAYKRRLGFKLFNRPAAKVHIL